jgi:hypothetical protein
MRISNMPHPSGFGTPFDYRRVVLPTARPTVDRPGAAIRIA